MDEDLERLSRAELVAEAKRLRAGIRAHRDSSGHDLCWHHPQLWGLLPEPIPAGIAVPPWPKFLRGCLKYARRSNANCPTRPCTTPNIPAKKGPDPLFGGAPQHAGARRGAENLGPLT
jgi:hypothetical protein